MSDFLFKDRDGQTSLPRELRKGLKPNHIQTMGELDEYEEENIAEGILWLKKQDKSPLDQYFWFQLHKKLFLMFGLGRERCGFMTWTILISYLPMKSGLL